MLLYCNKCAIESGNPITEEKVKGECGLCKRRLGPMNVMDSAKYKQLLTNNISSEILEIEGVQIRQIESFIPGTRIDEIEPTLPHRILKEDRILYFGTNDLIIAIPSTGKRIHIKL